MKKRLILFLIILSAISAINAQRTLPYKSISAFNNDTTAFLRYNFDDRKECYVGKTMSDLINDLGLPLKSFLSLCSSRYVNKYSGVCLYVYPYLKVRSIESISGMKSGVYAIWDVEINSTLLDTVGRTTNYYIWTSQIYNELKSYKIKEIGTAK